MILFPRDLLRVQSLFCDPARATIDPRLLTNSDRMPCHEAPSKSLSPIPSS